MTEGLDKEHEGEDITGGNRTSGPSIKDLSSEMKMSADEYVSRNSFSPRANAVCPHWKSAVLYELCTLFCARAFACVWVGIVSTLPVAITVVVTG